MYECSVLPKAQREHIAHASRYESKQEGLGYRYLQDYGATLSRIRRMPEAFRIVLEPDCRIVSLETFPYRILYHFDTANKEVLVLAVGHKHSRPNYWSERAASF